jgi:hypothetical protein
VAPLTTVVMNAVDQDHAGTASGINNAVARVASLLAIAILGGVMVRSFSTRIDRDLARLPIPPAIMKNLEANYIKLGALEIPASLDSNTFAEAKTSVDDAFVYAFRLVMLLCAGLSVASAVQAWWLIEGPETATPM